MAPREPRRTSVEHPPRPLPKRNTDADVEVLERPPRDPGFDEPARGPGDAPDVNTPR
jgi:hypothetical protein